MDVIIQTEREALKLRLLAVLLAAIGLYFAHFDDYVQPVFLVLGYLTYLGVLRRFVLPAASSTWIVYGMILVDVVAVCLGLLIGGQIGTALFILLPVLILYYSIHLGYSSSLAAATFSSLAYPAVAFATGEALEWGGILSLQVPLFYLLAIMGGFIAQKRLEERRQKESLQEAISLERGARSLLEVTRVLGNTLELDAVLDNVLMSSLRVTGLEAAIVAVRRKTDGVLVVRASNLKPEQLGVGALSELSELPEKGSLTEVALETLQPQAVQDVSVETRWLPPWASNLPYPAMLILPLFHRGHALGVLYLMGATLKPDFMAVAGSLSDLAGVALSNATLYEESQARVSHLNEQFGDLVGRVERLRQSQRKKSIHLDGLHVDLAKGEVHVEGRLASLSPVELELLQVLAENVGEPLSHGTLLRLVWGAKYEGQPNVVDVSIHRLRRKIEKNPAKPQRIITVRGLGYMLASAAQTPSTTRFLPPVKKNDIMPNAAGQPRRNSLR